MTDITNCPHKDVKAQNWLNILRQDGTANGFKAFCQLLQEHNVTSTKQFGKELSNEARSNKGYKFAIQFSYRLELMLFKIELRRVVQKSPYSSHSLAAWFKLLLFAAGLVILL